MQKVIFPFNAELKAELDQIRFAIQSNQNGVASRSMASTGYKLNYGVPYIALRKIAAEHKQNERLADCLWNIGYRETMLIATLLFPAESLTVEKSISLCESINEMELAEFVCKNLMANISDAEKIIAQLTSSQQDNNGVKIASVLPYLIASRLMENEKCDDEAITLLNEKLAEDIINPTGNTAKAISCYLKQLSLSPNYASEANEIVKRCEANEHFCARWIAEEVKTFIEYR